MSDRAQLQALTKELESDPAYCLALADIRQEISNQILKAGPAMLHSVASVMGIKQRKEK